ncbi:ROK family protein [Paenibacillus ehimensis]|uniref:ROK family transcriptional regulator n=1 Tax=Paenibacillus ehimensis TaxID=79264 RepID=UPI000564FA33|nr:ROK family protein [Paenibacillus ehimensis]
MKLPFVQPKMMGEMIRRQIRAVLYRDSVSTTAELVQRTGISFPTISKTLDEMNDQGEVLLTGLGVSSGGRRPKQYRLNADHMAGLAVGLEKDYSCYVLLNYVGEVIGREKLPGVLHDGPERLTEQIETFVKRYPHLRALTLGVPGAVNNGRVFHIPDYEKFKNFDFKSFYEERLSLRVQAENDMNATVLGYHDRSGGDQNRSLVYLYLGQNGPGAGIMVNGDVVRGSSFFSGEVSFLPIYDSRNFFQAVQDLSSAQNGKDRRAKLIDAMSRLVAVFTATLNPHTVIFCSTDMTESDLTDVRNGCASYVPPDNLPSLIVRDWEEDYFHGLNQLTIRTMLGIGID